MAETLDKYLDLLLPDQPSALLTPASRERIHALAAGLPAIPRLAVECHLDEAVDRIDIQLCVRDAADRALVAAHAAAAARDHPDDPALQRFHRFADELCNPESEIARGVEEIYLEYDLVPGAEAPRTPSVFLSLPPERERARGIAAAVLALSTPSPPGMPAAIERCFAACGTDEYVANLGLMIGRSVDAVRLNVKGLRAEKAERFLLDCGFPPEACDEAAAQFSQAVGAVDRVTLAFDIADTLLPRLGFECFLDEPPASDPTWRFRLHDLAEAGLCAADKATAFLAIPGETVPPATTIDWPPDVVRASLLRPESDFAAFARRAVHFKLSWTPRGMSPVKAYFGAGLLWRRPGTRNGERRWRPALAAPVPRRSVADYVSCGDALDDAIGRGVVFLRQSQLQSGLWRDYKASTGVSDEWVSGFVGAQLATTGDPGARRAAEECMAALARRQRAEGGWGYNPDHPADADSSCWVLRLAAALGQEETELARRGSSFISRHCTESGGIASFRERDPLATIAGLPDEAVLAGWLTIHDCVTAAAACFAPARATEFVRRRQQDGRWVGYWWLQDAFPTWLGVEALQHRPTHGDAGTPGGSRGAGERVARPG